MTVLPTVRGQICDAAERRAAPGAFRARRARTWLPRGWRRTPLIALVVGLIGVGGAFADGLIRFGSPAPRSSVFSVATSGLGSITPGTVRMLAISTPDPAGGPPWGLRVLSTTRGVGCVQVGRVEGGKLGAIGSDGAFKDDGLFHELPVSSGFNEDGCAALDAKGRLFTNVILGDQAASAAWYDSNFEGCVPAGKGFNPRHNPICPAADLRNIYYGLLGPYAKSITYKQDGKLHTVSTVGPEGAYLLVMRGSTHQIFDFAGGGTADVVPTAGPITAIHYIHGATCHLTSRSWMGGRESCSPKMPMPVGYVSVGKAPTPAQVRSPLTISRLPSRFSKGAYEYLLTFKSKIAVTSGRGSYSIQWHEPDMGSKINAYGPPTKKDIHVGQTISFHVSGSPKLKHEVLHGKSVTRLSGPPIFAPGVTHGKVIYEYLEGPGPAKVTRLVSTFIIRTPSR